MLTKEPPILVIFAHYQVDDDKFFFFDTHLSSLPIIIVVDPYFFSLRS